ncbi:hypothetical protein E2L06_06170 [Haloterrigena sp. H1]|uniref:hypothetical protein n=1 Tax=Haloterrigena sp. H1 TaxID=2552943 RepID=UPI00110EA6A6|nr:hypothetical protein [Haloterrigena sp. H1]TMT86204.1 hypothetical protein E2L06_06170 [Haloterrigena sp. H1]
MANTPRFETRRRFIGTGTATVGALAFGVTGSTTAQESGDEAADASFQDVISTRETYFSGAIFRVVSPPLENAPVVQNEEPVQNYSVRVIEYFNTNEEGYLFLPPNAQVERGQVYVFDDRLGSGAPELPAANLIRVEYRPVTQAELPFKMEEDEDFEYFEGGGGEAAVRPDDFYSSALFEITSGAQGWVPQDVEQSGLFTDYNTVHARYLGTNQRFLLFPQEAAGTNPGQLYVMRDESEIFDPAGNLVAAESSPVDEDSLTFDDEFLRSRT